MSDEKCIWKSEINTFDDDELFSTGCGNSFYFLTGNPKDNEFLYCPYCGGLIDDQSEMDGKQ